MTGLKVNWLEEDHHRNTQRLEPRRENCMRPSVALASARMTRFTFLFIATIVLNAITSFADDAAKPLVVFILAGQSNMEGKAKLELLEYQVKQPENRDLFSHFQKDGK